MFHQTVLAQLSLPKPTKAQLAWHQLEYYWFLHFGPNTFTNNEWGDGQEEASIFNPTNLDTDQWCSLAKAAGATMIIITAKHHDGFCLWPSKYSTHTVRESKWMNGKGDVLKLLAASCKKFGLKMGVYISPWDRNHPLYGTPQYNDVFVGMMKELFSRYGPITELWWDGANGEGPNGKMQVYDWDKFKKFVKQTAPQTVIFSDVGPHIRWMGNENGIAGLTNYNTLNVDGFTPGAGAQPSDTLTQGNKFGKYWIPAECDVSIRPGWFFHEAENDRVKTPISLLNLYYQSVGRGANLLLNVPPNRAGLIDSVDASHLLEFKNLLDRFNDSKQAVKWNLNKTDDGMIWEYSLDRSISCNALKLKEAIQHGQRIMQFSIHFFANDGRETVMDATTIGNQKIIFFPEMMLEKVIIKIKEAKASPQLLPLELYYLSKDLLPTNYLP